MVSATRLRATKIAADATRCRSLRSRERKFSARVSGRRCARRHRLSRSEQSQPSAQPNPGRAQPGGRFDRGTSRGNTPRER